MSCTRLAGTGWYTTICMLVLCDRYKPVAFLLFIRQTLLKRVLSTALYLVYSRPARSLDDQLCMSNDPPCMLGLVNPT